MRWRRPYRGYPRPPFRGMPRFPRVKRLWTVPNWNLDAVTGVVSGSTTTVLLMNYAGGGALTLDPRDISDDYIVDRVVGTFYYMQTANPAAGGAARSTFNFGIGVAEIEPTTGAFDDALAWSATNGGDSYRRWLFLHHSYPYQVNSAGSTPLLGQENTNAVIGPDYGRIDIKPRIRLKAAQRLCLFMTPEQSNGRTDTIWSFANGLRVLIHEGRT